MPERSSVAQVTQVGVETTPGTAVAATRRLGSLSIVPSVNTEVESFRPAGSKFATVSALNREWAEVSLEGSLTYEEVVYPLSGVLGAATATELLDGATPTGVYEWVFSPSTTAEDAPKTFTLEHGQSGVQAERYTHCLLGSFGLEVTRAGVSLSGGGFARAAQTGFTPTTGLALQSNLTPVLPGQVSVYLADTQAALSVTGNSDPTKRLTRVLSVSPSVEDKYAPAWFVNGSEQSFGAFVENADGVGGTTGLTVEADAAGMGLLANLRAGDTKFLRVEALGPEVYNAGTQPNLRQMLRWDMAVKVENAEAQSDEDGIYAIPYTLRPVHDTTWGRAMQVTVRNKVQAL